MKLRIRDAQASDLDAVLGLNRNAGVSVTALDPDSLLEQFRSAAYFRVAEAEDGTLAGFLIGTDHSGSNQDPGFSWFQAQGRDFVYIDRIVVGKPFRGHGLGRVLYADIISFAEVRVPVIGCQISLDPADTASLLFHASMGFTEATQKVDAGGARLGVMARELCSYPFVREQYLADGLPALPWLADRQLPDAGPACTSTQVQP